MLGEGVVRMVPPIRHPGLVPGATVYHAAPLVARWTALAFVFTVSGCAAQSKSALPPLSEIQKATLDYVTCIDRTAPKFADAPGSPEQIAPRVIASCSDLRSVALKLKSVPVMYPTIAEFDANHLGFAKQAIEHTRKKS